MKSEHVEKIDGRASRDVGGNHANRLRARCRWPCQKRATARRELVVVSRKALREKVDSFSGINFREKIELSFRRLVSSIRANSRPPGGL